MNQDGDSLLSNGRLNFISSNQLDTIETHPSENTEVPNNLVYSHPKVFRQLFAGFSATLSALSAGLVLGWTSPMLSFLTSGKYNNIPIDNDKMGWIGSFATLGAMAMCFPAGFICDLVGRKNALLLLILPYSVGWALIIWASTIVELYFGRLITGMAVGGCCVAAPLYNGEIAHIDIRGKLGSFFQLMICVGIFMAYLFGKFLSPYQFTIFCAVSPLVFFICFVFQPESPCYLIKKNKYEEAKESLLRLRGKNYNVEQELIQIEGSLKESSHTTISLRAIFSNKSIKIGILISFALMFFQQLSGINAIILYSSNMFKSAGIYLDVNVASIMVGGFQVVATFIASLVIEKLGRKYLLFVSLSIVTLSTMILAIYLAVKSHLDKSELREISFIPIGSLCLFVISFSLGLGPIPWMLSSEIIPNEIRSIVTSAAGTFNWFLAFIITKLYLLVAGQSSVFFAFTISSLLGTIFVYLVVPETKGKTLAQIQEALSDIV
ncbi:facilitated trehalose transporter Tret1-like [Rhynchophorus ferrugineus]|uniref:facilitated trehalose transporter Tret1-like n=1 Tax=Rhynchophorus ferrugineus TaxID=354439 RepID=UPI003FCC968F